MKKYLVILLLLLLTLLTVGTMVMAEDTGALATDTPTADAPTATNSDAAQAGNSGVNLYLDYSRINETVSGNYFNMYTIGIDYAKDFLVGAQYSVGGNYQGYPDGYTSNNFMVYGGYNIISQNNTTLGIIATYLDNSGKTATNNPDYDVSSIGIGFKGKFSFDSGYISLLYSYGVSNSIKTRASQTTTVTYSDKNYISIAELKGVYYFSETVGIHAYYRWIPVTSDHFTGSSKYSNFGIGVDFRF